MTEYASINELIADDSHNVHVECNREVSTLLLDAVRERYHSKRCAFVVETDRGGERETVASYLRFYGRIAGSAVHYEDAIAHFGLRSLAHRKLRDASLAEIALVNLARASLLEPELCFLERPLSDLDEASREVALIWMSERTEAGCRFITTLQPLRQALLMPGTACWHEDGRFITVEQDETEETAPPEDNEVRVCKIPAKAGATTLLFDPREIDFVESMNKATYLSVRGELYPTSLTIAELEDELTSFGFFRCHRSYLVNAQRVSKVERYTRNSFNLTLSDATHTSIPLAKGRAEEMRERFRW